MKKFLECIEFFSFFLFALACLFFPTQNALALSFGQGISDVQSQATVQGGVRDEYFQNFATSSLADFSTSTPIIFSYKTDSATSSISIKFSKINGNYCKLSGETDLWLGGSMHNDPNAVYSYSSSTGFASIEFAPNSVFMGCVNSIRDINFSSMVADQHIYGTSQSGFEQPIGIHGQAWFQNEVDTNIVSAYFNFSGDSYTEPPIVSFNYPLDGIFTPDFLYWQVHVQNPYVASTSYHLVTGVEYSLDTTSTIYIDYSVPLYSTFNDRGIEKTHQLHNYLTGSSSTVVQALPFYFREGIDGFDDIIQGEPIVFVVNNHYATPTSTWGIASGAFQRSYDSLISPTSTFFVDCSMYEIGFFSSSSLDGIACVSKKVLWDFVEFLVVPGEWSSDYFSNGFLTLKQTFPFSYVYATEAILRSVLTTTSTASTTLSFPIFGHGSFSVPLELETIVGSSTKALVFSTIENIIWLGTGIIIFGLIVL